MLQINEDTYIANLNNDEFERYFEDNETAYHFVLFTSQIHGHLYGAESAIMALILSVGVS